VGTITDIIGGALEEQRSDAVTVVDVSSAIDKDIRPTVKAIAM